MSRIDVQQNSEDGVIHEYNRQLCVGHVIGSLPINMKKQSQTVSVFFFITGGCSVPFLFSNKKYKRPFHSFLQLLTWSSKQNSELTP